MLESLVKGSSCSPKGKVTDEKRLQNVRTVRPRGWPYSQEKAEVRL